MALQFEVPASLLRFLLFIGLAASGSCSNSFSGQNPFRMTNNRLAKPLIGDDGRVYLCSGNNFFAFENNGSIAWTITLKYTCSISITPVHGGSRKIYLVAENRVLRVNPLNISAVEEFFGPEAGEIIGLAVSISSSCVIINVKRRGLFAYRLHGRPLWSAGPILYRHGYRQGCAKNVTDCYFSSSPIIDHCEATVYISNNKGELYSLSIRNRNFKWVQDFSSFDKNFTITPANNGILYLTMPTRALLLAVDVSTGNILWQGRTGPLSSKDYAPAVDSNGWISIGSLDGFLYSFSPTGVPKKFPKVSDLTSVIQVSPVLDCSGFAVYISRTEMEGKVEHTIGDYTFISALKPKSILFTLLLPATGSIYWFESYPPGQYLSNLSQSDLKYFKLDEAVVLSFLATSSIDNPFPCRSTRQKFAYSCSQTRSKNVSLYTGNEKTILLFLLFETTLMIILAALVRFCCTFWKKKKLQRQGLGKFLEKRHSLRLQKRSFDKTIAELEQRASEEAVANEVLEKLGKYVKEREDIERKLLTTYSLGRDRTCVRPKSLLPLYDGKTKSYSFQGAMRENVTIFHTFTNSSSSFEESSEEDTDEELQEKNEADTVKGNKGKAPVEVWSSSSDDEESFEKKFRSSSSNSGSRSRGFMEDSFDGGVEKEIRNDDEGEKKDNNVQIRRRTLSSTN